MQTARVDGISGAIRRNTWLLFLAQVCVSAGLSTSAQLGSLIVYHLSGTAALAGLPSAIYSLAYAGVGYPAGRFMDRRGRRAGLMLGFVVALGGALLIAAGVSLRWFAAYIAGMIVFSAGVGTGMLARAAAGDMYPASRRAGAVGLVVSGGLAGGLLGPSLVALGDRLGRALGANPLVLPWAFVFAVFAAGAVALSWLNPDPREIGRRLAEYFPDEVEEASPEDAPITGSAAARETTSVPAIIASRPAQAAMVALACAQASMVMLMATSSLMLSFHGHSTGTISLIWMAHILGMFALAVPAGRLADRVGRRPVLIGGALLTASSGLVFTLGVHSVWTAAVAFYLVGLGWCLGFIAGAALLGDLSHATTRGRVVGVNDLFTNLAAMMAALLSGALLARGGELTVGVLAAIVGSVPLLAIARAGGTIAPIPVRAATTTDGGR
ncbi:MAG: MFS transporter [Armatimonadota bacterium]|nr:MFS transporter [Armatimonadota bacterium]MDR7550962.1 MFS transporter [Armatimonadota bacterium]